MLIGAASVSESKEGEDATLREGVCAEAFGRGGVRFQEDPAALGGGAYVWRRRG